MCTALLMFSATGSVAALSILEFLFPVNLSFPVFLASSQFCSLFWQVLSSFPRYSRYSKLLLSQFNSPLIGTSMANFNSLDNLARSQTCVVAEPMARDHAPFKPNVKPPNFSKGNSCLTKCFSDISTPLVANLCSSKLQLCSTLNAKLYGMLWNQWLWWLDTGRRYAFLAFPFVNR